MPKKKIALKQKRLKLKLPKQAPVAADEDLTFDDLVIDGSLSPVVIIVSRTKKKNTTSRDDDLLTELQCEV